MKMTKYKTILADPPWSFGNKNTGGSMKSGSANKYQTLCVHDICNIEITIGDTKSTVKQLADKNAVLFLWIPTALSTHAEEVINAWGFKFKTKLYWYKPYCKPKKRGKLGMGFYFRNQIEECWIATRGKIKPFKSSDQNVIIEYPNKHSQKPEKFFELVEPVITKHELNPKIELFARNARAGWDGWGFEYPHQKQ
jgi:N6-adenosine-specific RNA methylase IME4